MDILRALLPRLTGRQFAFITIPLILLGGATATAVAVLIFLGASGGTITPAPTQPIAYDHSVHAGDNAIACEFCHRGVSTGAQATIPSVEQCMFCHTTVQGDQAPPEVAKLVEYFEGGNPINWGRVHRVPDHVQFVHEAHVRFFTQEKGFTVEETCAVCHSNVRDMEIVEQKRSLKMGDCVDCHRDNNAPTDCATCHY